MAAIPAVAQAAVIAGGQRLTSARVSLPFIVLQRRFVTRSISSCIYLQRQKYDVLLSLPCHRQEANFLLTAMFFTAAFGIVSSCELLQCEEPPQDEDEVGATNHDKLGLRSICAAIEAGSWALVEAWTKLHGVNAALTTSGQTALAFAAERGAMFIAKSLLEVAADPSSCDGQRLSALMHAGRNGHIPVVQLLLDAGAQPDWPIDIFGNAPIHGAVGFGHARVVQALLHARCDPDMRTGDVTAPESYGAQTLHEAPLHLACRVKPPHLELQSRSLVALLVHFGASPCLQDDRGDTPAHLLARKGDASALWTLLSRSPPQLADAAVGVLRNMHGATALEDAASADVGPALHLALSVVLYGGPRVAKLRQLLDLRSREPQVSGQCEAGEAAEDAAWKTYNARLSGGPSLLPFEEGGDGVRRRRNS